MVSRSASPRSTPFYGWMVVAGMGTVLTLTSGLGFYNLSVYLRAISLEYGLSVGAVSGPTGLFFFAAGISGLAIARLLDRFSVRKLMSLSVTAAGAALGLIGVADSVVRIYVIYALLGLCLGGASMVPGTTVITRWFIRKRALALAVASAGLSVGGIVVTPVSASLIGTYGLRTTMPILGLVLVVVSVPILLFVVRDDPSSLGLLPDGERREGGIQISAGGVRAREAFRSRFFVALVAGYFLVQLCAVGGVAHHFNLASTRLSEVEGGLAVSVLAASSLVGRLIGGWSLSYISLRTFLMSLVALQALGLGLLGVAQTATMIMVGSAVFGSTLGNLLMMETLLIAEVFGIREYARIFSVQQLLVRIGVALGPMVMGVLYDGTGSYLASYLTVTFASLVGMVVLWSAGPPKPMAVPAPA